VWGTPAEVIGSEARPTAMCESNSESDDLRTLSIPVYTGSIEVVREQHEVTDPVRPGGDD